LGYALGPGFALKVLGRSRNVEPGTWRSGFVHNLNFSLASIKYIKRKGRLNPKLFLEQKVVVDLIPEKYHLITWTN